MSNIWSKPHSVNLSFHPICRDMSLNFLSGEWLCDILIKQFRQVLEYRFSTHGANNFPHTARIWCLFLRSFPLIGQSVSQWPLNEIYKIADAVSKWYSWLKICYFESSRRAESWLSPSQWETSSQSNVVSHWLGANHESTLKLCINVTCHVASFGNN